MEFVSSEKGEQRLLDNGYLYHRERSSPNCEVVYWRCINRANKKCHARVHTAGEHVFKHVGEHNHAGNAAFVKKEMAVNQLKRTALESNEAPQLLIANMASGVSAPVAVCLPPVDSLKRIVRRVRQGEDGHPPNPSNRKDFVLADNYKLSEKKEMFLAFDSGHVDDRMLVFATSGNLKILARSKHWFCDGTFDASPAIFQQLYTIHALLDDKIVPVVYALLPGKKESLYRVLFNKLKELVPGLAPESVMTDLELAAINAMQKTFTDVKVRLCFFHFTQCIYRKVVSYEMKNMYDNDEDFAKKVKSLMALAFMPVEDVDKGYDLLVKEFFASNSIDERMQEFLSSFETEFIGRICRGDRRLEARFKKSWWNMHDAVNANLPRTNNNIEGWHRGFNELIKRKHPSIWECIDALKKEQSRNELVLEQLYAQLPVVKQKKKYKDYYQYILNIVGKYNSELYEDKLMYLISIANCISL